MAKGRLLGIQFYELFKDNLYFDIGNMVTKLALYMKKELKKKGITFFVDSYTNQQFPIFTIDQFNKISEQFIINKWEDLKNGTYICRICISWATKKENIDKLLSLF